MTAITVTVTAAHIARGTREDSGKCPVALAIRDAIPGCGAVAVDASDIGIRPEPGNRWVHFAAPASVAGFVWDFDDDGPEAVGPFTFTLDPDRPDGEPS
jgi:hypothetical protein